MLQAREALDVPAGWRAEILGEGIVLTPAPASWRHAIADRMHRALVLALGEEWSICQGLAVSIPERARVYEPDFAVVPRSDLVASAVPHLPASGIALAAEIVSRGNARMDRVEKLWGYGHGGVPLYLLIDRFDPDGPSVTLLSDPANGHYRQHHQVPFGKTIELPQPIGITLETGEVSRP
ncbi:MAG: Uma2 family endonuclease [Thermocrispum sp.]